MKLTPTIVVLIGSLLAATGALLLASLDRSPQECALLRAIVAIMIELFFIQIGYAQSLRERNDSAKRRVPPNDHPE